ncbi:MAG: hypothetical protein H7177_12200 [Rhizobacter sp.]|nr:hypothetical protein [Bacteriovorax sp.]
MGERMFGNDFFDQWLHQKSQEILNKVEKEKISTEDMLILSLKAQTNHFDHMDQEFRGEFQNISKNFENIDNQFKSIDRQFESVEKRFESRFEKFEEKFDKKFDRMSSIMMWQGGILATLISGIYFKLFLIK